MLDAFPLNTNLLFRRVAINGIPLQDASRNRIFQLFLNESPQTERFSRLYANDAIPPRYAGGPWRTYCYYRRLYAMPIPNALGSYARTITAQFYRENQAQLHRLMPWLNRELLCLCAASAESIEGLLSRVNNLIQTHDMTSREFRRRVAPLVPNHTNHFIHELINFARSPFDMIGYDRNVAYCPVFVDDMVVVVSSSDEDELLIVPVTDQTASTSGAAPAQESSGVNAPGMPTIIMSDSGESSGDDQSAEYALPNVATDVALNVDVACNITHNYEDSDEEISNFLQNKSVGVQEIVRGRASAAPETSTSSLYSSTILTNNDRSVIVRISSHASTAASSEPARVPTPAAGNDSDSDDCQFVCAKKPPHLRTPEFVELNSESDSDVVFVDMDVVPQPQPIKQENKELLNVRRLRHRTVVPPDSENGRNVLKVEQNSLFSVINVLNLPSTSSQWMGNAFSAPVQSSSAATFPVIRSRGKRIYETSESSSSSLTPSPAHTDSSSDGNRSSSHEEYVVPSSARKRKASTGSARKKYRKKSKSKTKSKSKSKPKKTERAQKRYKRSPKMRKIQNDDSSSTDSESEN